jgi:thiol-disulfide isomerase/thioredoxin
MKLLFNLSMCAIIVCTACSGKSGYDISGKVDDPASNGLYVYLLPYEGGTPVPLDSAMVENNAFSFKGTQETPVLHILELKEKKGTLILPFILENGHIDVVLNDNPKAVGTPENDAWMGVLEEVEQIRSRMEKVMKDLNKEDATQMAEAEKLYEETERQAVEVVKAYIQNNPGKQSAAKLLWDFRYQISENDRRSLIANSNEVFKSVAGIDKMMEHLVVLDKVAIGKTFTDFEMADTKGNMHALSEYVGKGKVVLIDFWASWCPPCRKEIPHLVELYAQYKGKDFEIVGISLDRTLEAWEKGIKDLAITWPQLSDLAYWKNAGAALYGVNSIPHTVLVGKDGTIIGKDLHGEELAAKLAELL